MAVWHLPTRERLFVAGADATNVVIAGMSYSPDSKQLMFADPERDKQITVLDLERRERVSSGIRSGARMFRFRPSDLSQVAVASPSD